MFLQFRENLLRLLPLPFLHTYRSTRSFHLQQLPEGFQLKSWCDPGLQTRFLHVPARSWLSLKRSLQVPHIPPVLLLLQRRYTCFLPGFRRRMLQEDSFLFLFRHRDCRHLSFPQPFQRQRLAACTQGRWSLLEAHRLHRHSHRPYISIWPFFYLLVLSLRFCPYMLYGAFFLPEEKEVYRRRRYIVPRFPCSHDLDAVSSPRHGCRWRKFWPFSLHQDPLRNPLAGLLRRCSLPDRSWLPQHDRPYRSFSCLPRISWHWLFHIWQRHGEWYLQLLFPSLLFLRSLLLPWVPHSQDSFL